MADDVKAPQRSRRRPFLIGFALAVVLGVAGLVALDAVMGPLSKPGFCASCHEMEAVHESWQKSLHHTNASGAQATCVDCHLPPREHTIAHLTAKAWTGGKDTFQHFFGTYDAEAARERVVRTLPSSRCLACHSNLVGAPSSEAVAIVHQAALGQPDGRAHACVTCHDALHGAKKEEVATAKEYPEADNSYCYVCHLNFQTEEFVGVHFAAGVGCERCHGISEPHMGDEESLIPPERMYTKAKVNASCMTADCHPKERMLAEIGHRPFFADAAPDHKHCTDCHGAHRLAERHRKWNKETRELIWTDGTKLKQDSDGM